MGEKEWRERESDGEREGEEEEIAEKQRGRKRKRDHFDCNFRCMYVYHKDTLWYHCTPLTSLSCVVLLLCLSHLFRALILTTCK